MFNLAESNHNRGRTGKSHQHRMADEIDEEAQSQNGHCDLQHTNHERQSQTQLNEFRTSRNRQFSNA